MRRGLRFGVGLLGVLAILSHAGPAAAQEIGLGGTGGFSDHPDLKRFLGLTAWFRAAPVQVRYDYLRHARTREDLACVPAQPVCGDGRVTSTAQLHALFVGAPLKAVWHDRFGLLVTPEVGAALLKDEQKGLDGAVAGDRVADSGPLGGGGVGLEVQFVPAESLPLRFLLAARERLFFPLDSKDANAYQPNRDLQTATLFEFGFRYEKRK
ncbi:MAG: hypothetical protein IRZ00_08565 [Gemmatimonadetes bacterium]|nr:hypothetical protein [Gemmatimonadota bacterium]